MTKAGSAEMAEKEEIQIELKATAETTEVADSAVLQSNAAETTDSMIGKVIGGKFEILSYVGSGGMSVVYKAKHLLLGKTVAMKILQSNRLKEPKDIQRFQQEAQAASSLNHPNVAVVREFGLDEEAHPYIVMDFVEAKSLAQLIEDQSLSPTRALQITAGLCRGLEHAHERGVVHRDIKPDNILIAKNPDGSDCPLIVDFGIARVALDDQNRTRLTQTGEVFGTPAYMSPEQALGLPVDRRSDLYSLGCVMYQMLSGKQPFAADNPLVMLMKHASEAPPPLDSVPAEIQSIVMKAMDKDPLARFGSAAALNSAIDDLANNTQVLSVPEWGYAKNLVLRAFAWIIDLAIVSAPGFLIACLLPQGLSEEVNRTLSLGGLTEQCMPSFGLTNMIYKDSSALLILLALLTCVGNYLYHALLESSKKQATLGKQVVGLITTNNTFGRLSFKEASYRHWSKVIYFAIYLLIAGVAPKVFHITEWGPIALFTMLMLVLVALVLRKRYQMLHDVISSAKVIPNRQALDSLAPTGNIKMQSKMLSACLRAAVVGACIGLVCWGLFVDIEQMRQAQSMPKR